MNHFQYLLTSSLCLSVAYSVYLLLFRGSTDFRRIRLFLMASVLVSVLIPFSSYKIELKSAPEKNSFNSSIYAATGTENHQSAKTGSKEIQKETIETSLSSQLFSNWKEIAKALYFIGFILLLSRIFVQMVFLLVRFARAEKVREDGFILVYNSHYKNSFSFFNWIFLNPGDSSDDEAEQILSHEKIHASQYHSLDLITIELLAAATWFNPLVWMMRNSIQLVHEYLADEGTLRTGVDKIRYQALLINIVAEERLICLSSSFNYSLIKKRMIMMNKVKLNPGTKYRILALIPLAAVLLLGVACIKGHNNANSVTAVELVKMNVVYIGVDNPVKIAVSGYNASDLEAVLDNGTISGSNGEYLIRPEKQGVATLTISIKGKEIQKTQFRAKYVPDPVAVVKSSSGPDPAYVSDGNISKAQLLSAGGIEVTLRNFDFDLKFTPVSFVLSATLPNSNTIREEISKSAKFSDGQISLINSLVKNQKLAIEEIVAVGPDGMQRKLNSMVFNMTGE